MNLKTAGPAALAALVLLLGAAASVADPAPSSAAAATCSGTHWVGSWEAAPSDALDPVTPVLLDQTVREIVTPHLGGRTLRLRLTNRFGIAPVRLTAVYVGLQARGAALRPDSNTRVTFEGRASVTIPAHGDVVSDRVRLTFSTFERVAVSISVPSLTIPTEHFAARQTSYLTAPLSGDLAATPSGSAYNPTLTSWPLLAGIDVVARRDVGAVVALGDSITDGWIAGTSPITDDPATRSRDERYPDFLAHRIAARPGPTRLSVLNAGISGNQVLSDASPPFPYGPSALRRLTRDVIDEPGVTDVIVMEGTNDLNPLLGLAPGASASAVIDGLRQVVALLHRHGIRVLLGTIPPRSDDQGNTRVRRTAINRWIRTARDADGAIDFARALADPADPTRLLPAYDSGDHLHPSVAGYRAMAAAVNLRLLRPPRCG